MNLKAAILLFFMALIFLGPLQVWAQNQAPETANCNSPAPKTPWANIMTSMGGLASLYPLLNFTNRDQLDLSFSRNPKILYRGFSGGIPVTFASMGLVSYFNGRLKDLMGKKLEPSKTVDVLSAAATGAAGSIICAPNDLVIAQLQKRYPKEMSQVPGYFPYMKKVFMEKGIKGLYQGGLPTMVENTIMSGLLLGVNPIIYSQLPSSIKEREWLAQGVTVGTGGLACALVTHPLNSLRTIVQSEYEAGKGAKVVPLFRQMVKENKLTSLGKGLLPRTSYFTLMGLFFLNANLLNKTVPEGK